MKKLAPKMSLTPMNKIFKVPGPITKRPGRICKNCDTKLSIYNTGRTCYICKVKEDGREEQE